MRAILGVVTDVGEKVVLDSDRRSRHSRAIAVLQHDGRRRRRRQLKAERVSIRSQLLQQTILHNTTPFCYLHSNYARY